MKAVIYQDTKTVEVQERAMPVCGPDDVIVRNVRGGIGSARTAAASDLSIVLRPLK
jgi:threonine dehydrogenase-like Zn-dependent dehydrogenase